MPLTWAFVYLVPRKDSLDVDLATILRTPGPGWSSLAAPWLTETHHVVRRARKSAVADVNSVLIKGAKQVGDLA
jgi:hypothetical protein